MTIYLQRETDDWVKKTITQDGGTYTGAWSYQIVPYGSRPTGSWTSSVINGSDRGVDVAGLSRGDYVLFIRIDGQAPYNPVVDPEFIIVS